MQLYNRPRGGPILHRDPMVARASRTAIDARQEPSAQSLVTNLILRRIVWSDDTSRPDDYEVRYRGRTVGRILRLRSTGRELWHWTQIGIRAPTYGPNGGVANTFEDAKDAFRRTWDGYGAFENAHGHSPRSNPELEQWLAGQSD